jgi:hypothetical protein
LFQSCDAFQHAAIIAATSRWVNRRAFLGLVPWKVENRSAVAHRLPATSSNSSTYPQSGQRHTLTAYSRPSGDLVRDADAVPAAAAGAFIGLMPVKAYVPIRSSSAPWP